MSDPLAASVSAKDEPSVGDIDIDVADDAGQVSSAVSPAPVADPMRMTLSRIVFWVLILAFCVLQHRLWIGEASFAEVWRLKLEIEKQEQENGILDERNRRLAAEVRDLREGTAAIEERARKQLGMIKDDETLYIINPVHKTP